MVYESIISETRDAVGIITLNRPKALNALNSQLIDELNYALSDFQEDAAIGCVIIAGSDKAFAAGADIREMKDKTFTMCISAISSRPGTRSRNSANP